MKENNRILKRYGITVKGESVPFRKFSGLYKKKAIGPINQRIRISKKYFRPESYTLSLITSLSSPNPVFIELRENSNSSYDFIKRSYLVLLEVEIILLQIMQHIHYCSETMDFFNDLQKAGISLMLLPKYSPECNPCELVFNFIKEKIKNNRRDYPLWLDIIWSILSISKLTLCCRPRLLKFLE
jgi:hypothetical protein